MLLLRVTTSCFRTALGPTVIASVKTSNLSHAQAPIFIVLGGDLELLAMPCPISEVTFLQQDLSKLGIYRVAIYYGECASVFG